MAVIPTTTAFDAISPTAFGGRSISENSGTSVGQTSGQQASQSASQSQSSSFIPNYSETPILDSLAQYAENMAPQVYNWGMQQYGQNQGDINALKRTADTFASGQRLAADVGQAEAGVEQAGEQAMNNSKEELESFGIDPSSGRYAALDQASRVQNAAAAAGAGNMQRNADIATSNAMNNQAIAAELQNSNFGLGVSGAMNNLLASGLSLKYAPLGNQSSSSSESSSAGQSAGSNSSENSGFSLGAVPTGSGSGGGGSGGGGPTTGLGSSNRGGGGGGGGSSSSPYDTSPNGGLSSGGHDGSIGGSGGGDGNIYTDPGTGGNTSGGVPDPTISGGVPDPTISGGVPDPTISDGGGGFGDFGMGDMGSYFAGGGPVDNEGQEVPGGYDPDQDGPAVEQGMSPSSGRQTDDVPAHLNAGEFVLPNDVVRWKGEEYFQKLISQSREARNAIMQAHGQTQGMNLGGAV